MQNNIAFIKTYCNLKVNFLHRFIGSPRRRWFGWWDYYL